MMSRLAQLQACMQSAILSGDGPARAALLSELRPAAHASREEMVGVYCSAYRARLAEILENDLECVARYLGEELFAHVASGYIDAFPSDVRNARYFSRHAARHLVETPPFSRWPQIAELAAIELALAEAFDAADAEPMTTEQLLQIPPDAWAGLRLTAHPAVRRLDNASNALAIWTALRDDTSEPPQSRILETPEPVVIWREQNRSLLRALPPAEAAALDVVLNGGAFADACATQDAPLAYGDANTATRAVGWLAGWVASGLFLPPEATAAPPATP